MASCVKTGTIVGADPLLLRQNHASKAKRQEKDFPRALGRRYFLLHSPLPGSRVRAATGPLEPVKPPWMGH